MAKSRGKPYVWVTWMTRFIAGDAQCYWALWFRAHYTYEKRPDERAGNLSQWKANHADMVRARAAELREQGWTVFLEAQNKFTLRGKTALLGGAADIVAIKGMDALVVDCKTGQQRDSDYYQVLTYQLALPLCLPALKGKRLAGEVQYPNGRLAIAPEELNPETRKRLLDAIAKASATTAPARTPSPRECAWCDIGKEDCPARIEEEVAVETALF